MCYGVIGELVGLSCNMVWSSCSVLFYAWCAIV